MSKVSQIYDALATLVATALPTYKKLPNPYDSSANANVILNKGYGIAIGQGSNSERFQDCQLSISRDFGIVLTKQLAKTDHDVSGRASQEKALFEDQFLVIKALETNPQLSGLVAKTFYVGDGGLEILDLETGRYMVLASQINVEYFENLT